MTYLFIYQRLFLVGNDIMMAILLMTMPLMKYESEVIEMNH